MNVSNVGKQLIKKYEGCKLTAYKPVATEKYWTIGWGHYGPDVRAGQSITKAQADALFDKDIQKYVDQVKDLKMNLSQNQFDALVSFCYNCGESNLKRLCSDRNINSISKWITAYNKGGGVVLNGLVRRRVEEKNLFDSAITKVSKPKDNNSTQTITYRVTAELLNIRKTPSNNGNILGQLKKGNTVQVVSIDKNGWAKIKSNNTQVYVHSTYLKNS